MDETNELIQQRLRKLETLKKRGFDPFSNDFKVSHTTKEIIDNYSNLQDEELKRIQQTFSIAGRILAIRNFGKASFIQILDRKGKLQAYIQKDRVGDEVFKIFKSLDIGDFVGITGKIFRTKTRELTIEVHSLKPLVKSLRPLPEKWHGLTDVETRYRHRYLDLISNPRVKEMFLIRIKTIQMIREFLTERDFMEVETPMLHPIPGGATAKPFKTYHNALNMELYMRIAPELYLKRLVIGGFERIFEINRCFRNEGISTQHNPEFTMLEFYQSYSTYEDLMNMTEELICSILRKIHGGLKITYQGKDIDFTPPWKRIRFKESLIEFGGLDPEYIDDPIKAENEAKKLGIELKKGASLGRLLAELFKELVEPKLFQPTFITHYPIDVSPLSRRNREDPTLADRFELFIAGREIANGFSELNDPIDQRERFLKQLKEREDEKDLFLSIDDDFIKALEYGMPPTAGEGIGIDRLVMILTDSPSIRDVIFFPLLRLEK